ncbi:hypothetical protein [Streptomyces sp. NPDC055085]
MTEVGLNASAADDFMSGGVKSCSFKGQPGISWSGEILEMRKEQARDYDTGDLKTWQDGNPVMQFVFKIQTDVRDPALPDDDGVRGLYIATPAQKKAVQDAVRAAAAQRPEVGGRITLTYTHDDVAAQKNPRYNPPKAYKAVYEAPNPFPPADGGWGSQAAPAAPAASAPAGLVDPELVKFLKSKGVTVTPEMTQATAEMIAKTFGGQG